MVGSAGIDCIGGVCSTSGVATTSRVATAPNHCVHPAATAASSVCGTKPKPKPRLP